jgi:hypothetical protein
MAGSAKPSPVSSIASRSERVRRKSPNKRHRITSKAIRPCRGCPRYGRFLSRTGNGLHQASSGSIFPHSESCDGAQMIPRAHAACEISGNLYRGAAGQPLGTRASRSARMLSPYNFGKCVRRTTRFQTARDTRGSGVPGFRKSAWLLRLRPTHPRTRPSIEKQVPRYSKMLCCDPFPSPCPGRNFRQSHPVRNHSHVCK